MQEEFKPIETVSDVLIDLLDDNRRRLGRLMARIDQDRRCLHWSPDSNANSIATTIWHMGRLFDVFLHQQALGQEPAMECWFRHGWLERTGYDPRGIGRDGWGTLNDYSAQEVAAVPQLDSSELLSYLDEVYAAVRRYLEGVDQAELFSLAPGFDRRYTRYQCIQMALMDNVRHLGEIYALHNRCQRETA